jgi:hypothetical protein
MVWNEEELQWKTTSNGRWPQNMKSIKSQYLVRMTSKYEIRISHQLLVGSYSNLKLKLMGSNQSVQRYEIKMTSYGRWPPTEDDLILWQEEYLSNHCSDLKKSMGSIRVYKGNKWRQPLMEDDLQWKMTSNYEKKNISAATGWI